MLGILTFSSFFFYSLLLVTFSNLNLVLFRFHVSEKKFIVFGGKRTRKEAKKKISNFLMKIKKKKENLYNKNF